MDKDCVFSFLTPIELQGVVIKAKKQCQNRYRRHKSNLEKLIYRSELFEVVR